MSLVEIWLNNTHQDHASNMAHIYFSLLNKNIFWSSTPYFSKDHVNLFALYEHHKTWSRVFKCNNS